MIIKRFSAFVAVSTFALMLMSCGFQLRGTNLNGTLPFKSVQIAGGSSAFTSSLKRYLTATGIQVTDDPKTAEAIIDIMQEARTRSVLSLNTQGRVREYSLQYRMQFRVKNNGNAELLPPNDILLKRTLSYNESQVLAKEAEAETLYKDMQDDMVQQILRRVAAVKLRDTAAEAPAAPPTTK
jgi:LPS-assembly lipoprotein